MSARRCVALSLSLLATAFLALDEPIQADEIEILELSPRPAATLSGIPAGTPIAPTASNSVTVVVRYRLDNGAARVQVFPDISGAASAGWNVIAPAGTVPACGTIRGPSAGRCAEAFTLICSDRTPASVTIDRVRASLYEGDSNRVLATDVEDPARYTFTCGGPPPGSSSSCTVIGAAGAPGAVPLPFGRDLPICRCLRDEGAREFRCGLLHPDFFLLRRTPIPLIAGRRFTEVWEFLALSQLDAPVTVEMTGAGLVAPVLHSFGAAGRQPGKIERFEVKAEVPKGAMSLRDRADFKYERKDAGTELERAWSVDRTLELAADKPR
jgi:hypothetical protein